MEQSAVYSQTVEDASNQIESITPLLIMIGGPDGCRQVFNLFVVEDYSHKDIADHLGISESTSKSQYHRARQLLKERITKQLQLHG